MQPQIDHARENPAVTSQTYKLSQAARSDVDIPAGCVVASESGTKRWTCTPQYFQAASRLFVDPNMEKSWM